MNFWDKYGKKVIYHYKEARIANLYLEEILRSEYVEKAFITQKRNNYDLVVYYK